MDRFWILKTLDPQGTRLLAIGTLLSTLGFICCIIQMDTLGCVGMGLQGILLGLSAAQRFHPLTLLWYTLRLIFAVAVVILAVVCVILQTTKIINAVITMVLALFMLATVLCEMLKMKDIIDKNKQLAEEIPMTTFKDSTKRSGDDGFIDAVLYPVPDEEEQPDNEVYPDIIPH